jgi:NAD(P)-dependent dehydrogenase (short-subunit alcohol dehydrogenase family)
VNAIAPGFFLTPLTSATRTPEQVQQHILNRSQACVLNRPGELKDVANAVLFLVSEESCFIAGQTLCVDGGRTDRM